MEILKIKNEDSSQGNITHLNWRQFTWIYDLLKPDRVHMEI
jgi:hypothetical protein